MAQVLTVSDIKPLLGNLSRANLYQVNFGGLSPGLQLFLSARGVNSNFVGSDVGLMCYQAQLPGSSLATIESNNYYGITENFAHTKIYTPLQLSFYCDDEYKSLKFLEHWMEYSNSGSNSFGLNRYASLGYSAKMKYPNEPSSGYKSSSVTIQKFENNVERVLEYSFIGLFPKSLSSTQVQYGPNSELTRISCSFSYDRYIAGRIQSYDFARRQSNNLTTLVNEVTDPSSLINRIIN